jgi:hypothetical protein
MIKASQGKGGVINVFDNSDIATLAIPAKMRLKTDSRRLLVWILLSNHG